MMAHLHIQPHAGQGIHQLGAHPHGVIIGREVKVTANIVRHRVHALSPVAPKQEEFRLWADVELPASLLHPLEHALEHAARVAGEGLPIWLVDIAEHARPAHLWPRPRQHGVSSRIQHQAHIAFLDARKPFYRRAIEPDALFQGRFQAGQWDIHALDRPGHVGELQRNELNTIFLDTC